MGAPILKLIYDRNGRASNTKEGSVELRITYNRIQRHITTGVKVLPRCWKDGNIANCPDAAELQRTLDIFVSRARKVINDQVAAGTLDMNTIVGIINGKQRQQAEENVLERMLLLDYMKERATIRKHGRTADSQERYDRFLRWFEAWGGMVTFADITEANIIKMDETLTAKGLKSYSIWNNYHRFLNSFILDAINDGIIRKNPYKSIHINKEPTSDALEKCLTKEEFARLAEMDLPTNFLRHARDLFVFQTYTCLSYVDLQAFDASKIREVNGRQMYVGRRGKTNQEFIFMLLPPAQRILDIYGGKLPLMTNQQYNQQLKNLAVMAGIKGALSSHWARHTGATLLLNSGAPMEVVSRVLGHSSTKITREVYAKMLDETIADAMSKIDYSRK